jgi:thioredoxin-like negative regulator of GroEL
MMWRAVLRGSATLVLGLISTSCRTSSKTTEGQAPPSFVENNYASAVARAKSAHVPLFVDAWAPWCHTCLAMKASVFGDPALAPLAAKFVWAAIDTEKRENATFTERFPMQAWPTLWVIDSSNEKPILKWPGSATASELVTLLEAATGATSSAESTAGWIRGNRAVADGQRDAAIVEYQNALERAPRSGAERGRIVEALASQLEVAERHADALALSLHEWASVPRGTSRLNVVLSGLAAGDSLPKEDARRADLPVLLTEAGRMVTDPAEPVLADDRSSLFEEVVLALRSGGNEVSAMDMALRWRDFLEAEAAKATTASARAVFDSHRMLAYEAVGKPERAIPMLEQSERDFPDDYNPPARLAKVYLDAGRLDDALAAIGRAEKRVYGPRALRVLSIKADVLVAMKKPGEAKAALVQAVRLGEELKVSGGYKDLLERVRKRANEM